MTLKYDHLVGLRFDLDRQNCYQLLRAFYRDNYGIELTDWACPTNWWAEGLDLISQLSADEGFTIVNDPPRLWRPGDVILTAIQSRVGNHIAILLPGGRVLHHLYGALSCVAPYGGSLRNNTLGVYRHRDVPELVPEITNLRELLPAHVQRRLAASPADAGT